jgi:hypothetical protein
MEAAFKRGFQTYGGKKLFSSIMISPAKITPPAVTRFLQSKINMLDTGKIRSSPQAQEKLCQLKHHAKGTCPICAPHKEKAEKDLISLDSSDDE